MPSARPVISAGAMPLISAVTILLAPRWAKRAAERAADGEHQRRVDLVVDETVDLQDAVAHVDAFTADTFFE